MNNVLGISQNKSIVKSSGRGSLNNTLALKWPTRIDGKKLLVEDLEDVERSKHEKKNPALKLKKEIYLIK